MGRKRSEAALNKPYRIQGQQSKGFWGSMTIRPDIVIKDKDTDTTRIIIDTKWKHIEANKPSTHDLRQMYVYNDHWASKSSILLYPGNDKDELYQKEFTFPGHTCGILKINVLDQGKLDQRIGERLLEVFEIESLFNNP